MLSHYQSIALTCLASLAVGFAVFGLMRAQHWRDHYKRLLYKIEHQPSVLDPWELQERLMRISGQRTPAVPTLHKGSLMYAALCMEELGETLTGFQKALARATMGTHAGATSIMSALEVEADALLAAAHSIRGTLSSDPSWGIFSCNLTLKEAIEILDGTTDLAVVNCGLALASGLPGSEAYAEVVNSNLSKKNPATGVIDKDPSGKWIKGPNYREPDLRALLKLQRPTWWYTVGGIDSPIPGTSLHRPQR